MSGRKRCTILSCSKRCLIRGYHESHHGLKWVREWSSDTLRIVDFDTYASKAFLFSLYNKDGYNPVKLTQYQNQQDAMYHCSSYGPTFGYGAGHVHDIYISDNPTINQSTNSYTRCGSTYSVPPGYSAGDCGFFTGALYFTPSDIEVFHEIGK